MSASHTQRKVKPAVRVAHLSVPKIGEKANGDRAVFREDPAGRTLFGIVDALGHGPEAQDVALTAVEHLSTVPLERPLGDLMEGLHASLRGSRGAAATICLLCDGVLEACGVGNVDLRCAEAAIPFLLSPGILGLRVSRFRVCSVRVATASRLVLFSDGVNPPHRFDKLRVLAPPDACQSVLDACRRPEDDATVLIADLG